MSDERGTVLLEMIVLGFATVLLVLPALITIARIVDASSAVEGEARSAATWVARHGRLPSETDPRISIEVTIGNGNVQATARSSLTLVAIGGLTIERGVSASFDAPISPYRSDQ